MLVLYVKSLPFFLALKHVRLPKGEIHDMVQASRTKQRSAKHNSKAKGQSR